MVNALSLHKKPEVIARQVPKFENKKNGLMAKRRKDTPKLPADLPAINIDNDRYRITNYNRRFLLFDTNDDDRIIAHSSNVQLRWHIQVRSNFVLSILQSARLVQRRDVQLWIYPFKK